MLLEPERDLLRQIRDEMADVDETSRATVRPLAELCRQFATVFNINDNPHCYEPVPDGLDYEATEISADMGSEA